MDPAAESPGPPCTRGGWAEQAGEAWRSGLRVERGAVAPRGRSGQRGLCRENTRARPGGQTEAWAPRPAGAREGRPGWSRMARHPGIILSKVSAAPVTAPCVGVCQACRALLAQSLPLNSVCWHLSTLQTMQRNRCFLDVFCQTHKKSLISFLKS